MSNPSGETFGWTYLDNGWLWQQQSGNAETAIYTYNALGQVTELAHRKSSNNALLADFANLSHDVITFSANQCGFIVMLYNVSSLLNNA